MIRLILIGVVLSLSHLQGLNTKKRLSQKVEYAFYNDPIDVVIPCAGKDVETLEFCIEGVKQNVENVRRIIVVSPERYTDHAEWFDEKRYPFNRFSLGFYIFDNQIKKAKEFASNCPRAGWIYQQLLKLYAPVVIPDISSNVLIVDADVVFFNRVEFLGESGGGLYATSLENWNDYFVHMNRLLPGLKRVYPKYSGIVHHMLFQRSVLEDLFSMIEAYHKVPAWAAICQCINPKEVGGSCLSEYEIYFNFAFSRSNQVKIRPLRWANKGEDISEEVIATDSRGDFDYVAYHAYNRKKPT